MSPELEHLIQLQQLESAIADARAHIAAHPQRMAETDAKLAEADRVVQGATQRLKDAQEAKRTAEKDAAVFDGRLTKFKDQLSAVKTNREYQAMQHEIETAKRERDAAEDKVLERMEEIEALTAEVKQAEIARAAQKKTVDAEKAALVAELAADEQVLAEKTAGRAALVAAMEPRLMALFEQVAKVRKGVALSMATRDGLCSICHVRMRPQVFQQVRQNDAVIQCDSCQRILYWVPPPAPTPPPVTIGS
jgi:predicted  nucleic acid-binding Zn-ribbon protein